MKYEIPPPAWPAREHMIYAIGRHELGKPWLHLFGPKGTGSGFGHSTTKQPHYEPSNEEIVAVNRLNDELRGLNEKALQKRFQIVRNAEETAEQERIKAEERKQFFNQKEAVADFEYWARTAHWSPEELVSLTFGQNPKVVTLSRMEALVRLSPFAKDYLARYDLVSRAIKMKQLTYANIPTFALAWCHRIGLDVDERLTAEVEALGVQVADWKTVYNDLRRIADAKDREISYLKEQLDRKNAASNAGPPVTKPAETKKRNTLLKIIAGMASDAYGWRPTRRGTAARDIEAATENIGSRVNSDTARDVLAEAAEFVVVDPDSQ